MSIALESSTSNRIQRSGLSHGMTWGSVYDSPESGRPVGAILAGDRRLMADSTPPAKNVVEEREGEEAAAEDSSSSSSIGRNSDSLGGQSDGDGDSGEAEVQSSFKGPLDGLEALEEVLPMKRSMSKFYSGKSKSFTSLADATSCSSIKEIVKPENAYTRKRKNLLAHSVFWDKNRSSPLRSNSWGISKRPTNSNRSTLALAVTMSSFERSNSSECFNSNSSSPTLCRPPLYPQSRRTPNNESSSSPPQWNISSWRSFSLSDLQRADAAETPGITGKVISNGDMDKLL